MLQYGYYMQLYRQSGGQQEQDSSGIEAWQEERERISVPFFLSKVFYIMIIL